MASCGPSNALQNLKSHVQRDASLQREGVSSVDPRQKSFRSARFDDRSQQFDTFNSFDPRKSEFFNEFGYAGPTSTATMPRAPGHLATADVGYRNAFTPNSALTHDSHLRGTPYAPSTSLASQARGTTSDWASEFAQSQNASLRKPGFNELNEVHQSGLYPVAGPQYGIPQLGTSSFPAFGSQPLFPSQTSASLPTSASTSQQQDPTVSSALDAAFLEAEQSLRNLQLKEKEQQHQQQQKQQIDREREQQHELNINRGNDASAVAAQIINSVNDRADTELSSKVQGSKFMNLMAKLKNNEVKIDEKQFVDTSTNAEIDTDTLTGTGATTTTNNDSSSSGSQETSNHDWPPQLPHDKIDPASITREQPPELEPEPKRAYRFSRDLDDPDTYLKKLRQNLDPRLFEKSPYTSPFEKAQELAPSADAVQPGGWEETYEDW